MPRYFFNIRNHVNTQDFDGVELLDLASAAREARKDIAEIIKAGSDATENRWPEWAIEICDADQNVLLVVPFSSN